MRSKPKQLDLELEQFECAIARLVKSASTVRSDIDKRAIRELRRENRLLKRKLASCMLVMEEAKHALRIARGGSFNPQSWSTISGSYKLIERELAA